MHWFWRATIAVGIAATYVVSLYYPPLAGLPPLSWLAQVLLRLTMLVRTWCGHGLGGSGRSPWQSNATVALIHYLPAILVALAAYGVLTRLMRKKPDHANETRCRKCGYILRGISEPRCSECGERI